MGVDGLSVYKLPEDILKVCATGLLGGVDNSCMLERGRGRKFVCVEKVRQPENGIHALAVTAHFTLFLFHTNTKTGC